MKSTKLRVSNISSICHRDDADTKTVKESLKYSLLGNISVVAEDVDIIIFNILITKGNQNINL